MIKVISTAVNISDYFHFIQTLCVVEFLKFIFLSIYRFNLAFDLRAIVYLIFVNFLRFYATKLYSQFMYLQSEYTINFSTI